MLARPGTTREGRSGNWSGSAPGRVPRWISYPLRPSENGAAYRAGTRVAVLQRGSVRRGSATLSCVRVLDDVGTVGWAFVTDAERARCAGAHEAPAR